jgi:hypothetical protein
MLKFGISGKVWQTRYRIGQDPDLYTPLPLIDSGSGHVGQGMRYFACRVDHDGVCRIHELIKSKFVNEGIGFLLISIEGEGFLPLEGFVIESPYWDSQGSGNQW